jgi:hypothetical protein
MPARRQAPASHGQTQISEGGPRGWAAATRRTGGARGCAASSRTMMMDCRSGSVGVGVRMADGSACARQIAHRAQRCEGWTGVCCAGCVPSARWQIGTLSSGSAPTAIGASEIVASSRIWQQTASNDAANPIVGRSPPRDTVVCRSGIRHTGHRSIRHHADRSNRPGTPTSHSHRRANRGRKWAAHSVTCTAPVISCPACSKSSTPADCVTLAQITHPPIAFTEAARAARSKGRKAHRKTPGRTGRRALATKASRAAHAKTT